MHRSIGRAFRVLRWVALAFVVFGLGVFYAATNQQQIKGLVGTVQLSLSLRNKNATGNWFPARFAKTGLLRRDPGRTQPGYTLYGLAPDLSVHLIDMEGRELHRWAVTRDQVDPAAAKQSRTFYGLLEAQLEGRHLYPNGDLLAVYGQQAAGDWGGPLLKLDKDSHILWKADIESHHMLQVVGDRIYVLTQTFHPPAPPPAIVPNLDGLPYIEDFVSVLDADGHVLSTHSVLQALAKSKAFRLGDLVPQDERADPLHTNALDVLTEQTARAIPGAKAGEVLISLKHMDMLAVLDLDTDTIVWALRGSFRAQHDAKMLPNGHILMFDNDGGLSSHGRSRALEIDPVTGAVVWSYNGKDGDKLDSETRGAVQRLPNGDTLIAESTSGRLLEVTPDGSVVWEYVQPMQIVEHGQTLVPALGLSVARFDPSQLTFLGEPGHEAAR